MSHISHYNEYNLLYLNELIRLTYYTPYALIDYVFALAPIHTVLSSLKNASMPSMSQNGLIFHGFEQRELRLNSVQKFQKFEMSQFLRRKHNVQCIIPKCRNATDVVLK